MYSVESTMWDRTSSVYLYLTYSHDWIGNFFLDFDDLGYFLLQNYVVYVTFVCRVTVVKDLHVSVGYWRVAYHNPKRSTLVVASLKTKYHTVWYLNMTNQWNKYHVVYPHNSMALFVNLCIIEEYNIKNKHQIWMTVLFPSSPSRFAQVSCKLRLSVILWY